MSDDEARHCRQVMSQCGKCRGVGKSCSGPNAYYGTCMPCGGTGCIVEPTPPPAPGDWMPAPGLPGVEVHPENVGDVGRMLAVEPEQREAEGERCVYCGTPTDHGRETVDGRPHTEGQCLEYVRAALGATKRELADLRARLAAETARRESSDALLSKTLHEVIPGLITRVDVAERERDEARAECEALRSEARRLQQESAASEAREAELRAELQRRQWAVTDQLHYDMRSILADTPEHRARMDLAAARADAERLRGVARSLVSTMTDDLAIDCACDYCKPRLAMLAEARAALGGK